MLSMFLTMAAGGTSESGKKKCSKNSIVFSEVEGKGNTHAQGETGVYGRCCLNFDHLCKIQAVNHLLHDLISLII